MKKHDKHVKPTEYEKKQRFKENQKVLYKIKKSDKRPKYNNTRILLMRRKARLYYFLLDIYKWANTVTPYIHENKQVYILTTELMKHIRGTNSKATANKYLNYLVSLGFIGKLLQTDGYYIEANKQFKAIHPNKKNVLGVFYIYKLTQNRMDEIEQNATELLGKGITQGNISNKVLRTNNLDIIADDTYKMNEYASIKEDYDNYKQLLEVLQNEIQDKGYTSKYELINLLEDEEKPVYYIKKLLMLFKNDLKARFNYKPPTQKDKELYNLTSNKWIYTKK